MQCLMRSVKTDNRWTRFDNKIQFCWTISQILTSKVELRVLHQASLKSLLNWTAKDVWSNNLTRRLVGVKLLSALPQRSMRTMIIKTHLATIGQILFIFNFLCIFKIWWHTHKTYQWKQITKKAQMVCLGFLIQGCWEVSDERHRRIQVIYGRSRSIWCTPKGCQYGRRKAHEWKNVAFYSVH